MAVKYAELEPVHHPVGNSIRESGSSFLGDSGKIVVKCVHWQLQVITECGVAVGSAVCETAIIW